MIQSPFLAICSAAIREALARFRQVLLEAGIMTITRRTRGDDIDAACGQLAGKVNDRTRVRLGSKFFGVAVQ